MARGVDGRSIFEDDVDRLRFMESLVAITREAKAGVIAYCLMGNHFHLLLKIHTVPLSAILQRILTRYALTFNMRHGRAGHLFQARYKAIVVLDEHYLIRLTRYIHENPVRAGLTPTAASWRWSSAAGYTGLRDDAASDPESVAALLREMDPIEEAPFDPWQGPNMDEGIRFRPVQTLSDQFAPIDSCLRETGHDAHFLRSRQRDAPHTHARRAFVQAALARGMTVAAIARWLGYTPPAILHLARR